MTKEESNYSIIVEQDLIALIKNKTEDLRKLANEAVSRGLTVSFNTPSGCEVVERKGDLDVSISRTIHY